LADSELEVVELIKSPEYLNTEEIFNRTAMVLRPPPLHGGSPIEQRADPSASV
jgi:hypothetical protein